VSGPALDEIAVVANLESQAGMREKRCAVAGVDEVAGHGVGGLRRYLCGVAALAAGGSDEILTRRRGRCGPEARVGEMILGRELSGQPRREEENDEKQNAKRH
jgi:hypothetical protein